MLVCEKTLNDTSGDILFFLLWTNEKTKTDKWSTNK